jgi:hypothetical protein
LEHPYTFEPDAAKPAIYSPRVILTFSVLFSGLAGGILAYYSLIAAGQPTGAQRALKLSIMYVVLLVGLSILLPLRSAGKGLSLAFGYGWGYFLNEYYLKKYVPNESSYPRKSWVKPLLIWLAVLMGVFGFFGALNTL